MLGFLRKQFKKVDECSKSFDENRIVNADGTLPRANKMLSDEEKRNNNSKK